MPEALIEIRNLTKQFRARSGWRMRQEMIPAIDGVTLDFQAGETMALVGESGCGKSTLGRCVLRLLEPTSGDIRFEGRSLLALSGGELRRARRHMQIVFQDPFSSLNPHLRVRRILAEPFDIHESLPKREVLERCRALMTDVGLPPDALDRFPHEFSGGQRQRIAIARALALRPKFIVADEPVSSLDASVGAQIIRLLRDLQHRYGVAYLFISHSLPAARAIAARIAVMYAGRIVELGPAADVLREPLHPYTAQLLLATPDIHHPRPPHLAAEISPPAAEGCPYRLNCPLARARCAEEHPPLRELMPGRFSACHFAEEVPGLLR